ncbi:MAG: helix-turn-helix domain-containing protein [Cytophagaceae bacterium]|nr:helix-turn-helix domain-containing protein [Cytophagaceae bacterium]MDW8456961.1 helix-turn-helix domain-containing protein [Cytophagaceae bacterium]
MYEVRKKAAELFENEANSIKEVMVKVGFNNRNIFIKHFKEVHKTLPSEYKRRSALKSF